MSSLAPRRKAIALSYQNLKLAPKSAIKVFLSLVIIIHKNYVNTKKAMIVMPRFNIMPITSI